MNRTMEDLDQEMMEFFLRAPQPRQFPVPKFEVQVEQRTLGTKLEAFPIVTKASDDDQRVLGPPPPDAPMWDGDGEHGHDNIRVRWFAVAPPFPGDTITYNLKRRISGVYVTIASGLEGLTYHDSGLEPDKDYSYKVSAEGAGGEGENSVILTVHTDTIDPPPPPSVTPYRFLLTEDGTEFPYGSPVTLHMRAVDTSDVDVNFFGTIPVYGFTSVGDPFNPDTIRFNGAITNRTRPVYISFYAGLATVTLTYFWRSGFFFTSAINIQMNTFFASPSGSGFVQIRGLS